MRLAALFILLGSACIVVHEPPPSRPGAWGPHARPAPPSAPQAGAEGGGAGAAEANTYEWDDSAEYPSEQVADQFAPDQFAPDQFAPDKFAGAPEGGAPEADQFVRDTDDVAPADDFARAADDFPNAPAPPPAVRAEAPAAAPVPAAPVPAAPAPAALAPAAPGGASKAAPKGLTALERGIAAEINRLRRNPRAYAKALAKYRSYYDGSLLRLPGNAAAFRTSEGVAAVDEAIAAARASKPRRALRLSPGLSRAARAHAKAIGAAGTLAHASADGSSPHRRMQRHGQVVGMWGENIGTGQDQADFAVMDLFIDDGVPNRGHRTNLLQSRYGVVGVGCAPHRRFRVVCVMDFAEGFVER